MRKSFLSDSSMPAIGAALLLAASSFAPSSAHAQAAAGDTQADERSTGLTDIIVTAQKREQNLQDVPVAVTALATDALAVNRVQNVADLNAIVPNLTVQRTGGGSGIPGITLRGILSLGVAPGADRQVGMYLDGVYIGHAQSSLFDVAEIQRIEVLRGPQGTLFGRNATAGAISIITHDPLGRFDLSQETSIGNFAQFRSRTRVDLPAIGPFSVSATFTHTERRGDVRNLGAGTVWDYGPGIGKRVSPKYLGDEDTDALALAVKFDPTDKLSISYKFDWTDMQGTPNAQGVAALNLSALGPGGAAFAALFASQPDPSILTPISTKRPDAVNNWWTTRDPMRVSGHNLTARWQLGEHVSLKDIMAFRKASLFTTFELSGYGGIVNTLPSLVGSFGPLGTPIEVGGSSSMLDYHQFSNELQLNVDTRFATITAGYLHYHQRSVQGQLPGIVNVAVLKPVPDFVIPSADGGPAHTKASSDAGYIQVEAHLADWVDLVGGYRVTRDDKSGTSTTAGLPPSFSYLDTNGSYLAGINVRPADHVLLYAKYSTAFVSGGSSFGFTFLPEKARSWEAGVKADLFDRMLRANLALFSVRYDNMQAYFGGATINRPEIGVVVLNVGSSRARGFEFEGTAAPIEGLTLNAGIGYTDFKYLTISPLLGTLQTFLPHMRPKWTTNLAVQYETLPLIGDARLRFRLDGNYRSRTLLTPNLPAAIRGAGTNPPIWIINGRVALSEIPLAGHKGEIAIWGRNLTNDRHAGFNNYLTFMLPTTYERARTFGVDLRLDW